MMSACGIEGFDEDNLNRDLANTAVSCYVHLCKGAIIIDEMIFKMRELGGPETTVVMKRTDGQLIDV